MNIKKSFLIKLLFGFLFFILYMFNSTDVYATTIYNGGFEFKMATGSYQDGIQYGNAVYPEWITGVVPNSSDYAWIPGATNNGSYYFVRYMNLYFTSDTSFQVGKTYSLDLLVEHGSYITWSDYYGWGLVPNRNIGYCNGSSQNDLSQCSIQWNPVNESTQEHMIIIFRPNITTSQFSLEIGSTALNNNNFVLWNRFGGQQGFRVSSITITDIQNSANPSQDFSDVVDAIDNSTIAINNNTSAINDLNDNIMSDDVDDAEDDAEDFFNDFSQNTHGLTGIITAPLRLINSLSSSSCSSLTFPLPFVSQNVVLPCMSTIYTTYFPTFLSIYQLITTGIIAYWVCLNLFRVVKNLQDPDSHRIEVLDL